MVSENVFVFFFKGRNNNIILRNNTKKLEKSQTDNENMFFEKKLIKIEKLKFVVIQINLGNS